MLRMKNTSALNEKGNLKPAVRTSVAAHVAKHPELFARAEKVEGKNAYTLPVEDANGNIFYINFDVTVSTKPASERAEKKSKPKAKVVSDNTIDVE